MNPDTFLSDAQSAHLEAVRGAATVVSSNSVLSKGAIPDVWPVMRLAYFVLHGADMLDDPTVQGDSETTMNSCTPNRFEILTGTNEQVWRHTRDVLATVIDETGYDVTADRMAETIMDRFYVTDKGPQNATPQEKAGD